MRKYFIMLLALLFVSATSAQSTNCEEVIKKFEETEPEKVGDAITPMQEYLQKNEKSLTSSCKQKLYFYLALLSEMTVSADAAAEYQLKSVFEAGIMNNDTLLFNAWFEYVQFCVRNQRFKTAEQYIDSSFLLLKKKTILPKQKETGAYINKVIFDVQDSSATGFEVVSLQLRSLWQKYYQLRGNYYLHSNNFRLAEEYLLKAYALALRIPSAMGLAKQCMNNLGNMHMKKGNYEKAIIFFHKSLIHEEKDGDYEFGRVTPLYNLGTCYLKTEQYEKAEEYLQQSIEISRRRQMDKTFFNAIPIYATALMKQNKKEAAMKILHEGVDKANAMKAFNKLGNINNTMGNLMMDAYNDLPSAKKHFDESRKLALQYGDSADLYINSHSLADYYYTTGNYSEAKKYALEAIPPMIRYEDRLGISNILYLLHQITAASGDYKEALEYYKKHKQLQDSLNGNKVQLKVAELEKQYNTQSKAITITRMEKESAKQELALNSSRTRNRWLFAAVLLFALAGLLIFYFNRRLKKQSELLKTTNEELKEVTSRQQTMFGIIGHDLKAMIIPFHQAGKILSSYVKKGEHEKMTLFTEKLEENSMRLSGTLNNLLYWSLQKMKRVHIIPEAVDVKTSVDHVTAHYTELLAHKQILVQNLVRDTDKVTTDKEAFLIIVRNIFSNAVKFTEKGTIVISSAADNGYYTLAIKDSGTGMSKEKIKQLLSGEQNERAKGTRGETGSGLGFAVVNELIKLQGGEIHINSSPGGGTTVTIHFKHDEIQTNV